MCRKWLLNGVDNEYYTVEEEAIPEALLTEDLEEATILEHEEEDTHPYKQLDEEPSQDEELRERHPHRD